MVLIDTVFRRWEEGEITGQEALESLVGQLTAVEDSLVPLEDTKKALRAYISEVVERMPGSKIELPGYGKFEIRSASLTKSYDSKLLDALVMELIAAGQADVARAIANCKKESVRTGGLVITKARLESKS